MDIKSQQINLTNEKQLKSSKPANQSSADFANELLEVKKEVAPIDKTPETENVPKKENTEAISTNNIDLVKNNIISKQNKETLKSIDSKTKPQTNKNPGVNLTLENLPETNSDNGVSANFENLQNNIKEIQQDLDTNALPTMVNDVKPETKDVIKNIENAITTQEENIELETKKDFAPEKEYIIETLTTENKKTNKELIPDKEIKISNKIEEVIESPKPELLEQTGKGIEIPTTSNSKKFVKPVLEEIKPIVEEVKTNNTQEIIELPKEEKPMLEDKPVNNITEKLIETDMNIGTNITAEKPVIEKIKTGDEPEKVELPKNEKQFVEENHLNKAIESLNTIVKELNQSDDNLDKSFKKDDDKTDNKEVINNDFNIQENKDLLPQMTPNMNFSGDGQPFSSFMNNDDTDKKQEKKLKATAQDLAEEAAILSTMAENIAIANKNQIKQPEVKTVTRQDGIKKVDTKTNITVETVVKYDSVIMNEADVEVFANLVENQEVNLKDLAPKAAEKSIEVSKTLADMLSKAMEKNQPVRIDFDNNISVIIRISRDGKLTADFLPSSQVAEAYLKENLPLLRQKFDDSNIDYESLNQRERRDQSKENNRKKGRNNE